MPTSLANYVVKPDNNVNSHLGLRSIIDIDSSSPPLVVSDSTLQPSPPLSLKLTKDHLLEIRHTTPRIRNKIRRQNPIPRIIAPRKPNRD